MTSDTPQHESELRQLLASYVDPYLGLTLDAAGAIKSVNVVNDEATVAIELGFPAGRYASELTAQLEQRARGLSWLKRVHVHVSWQVRSEERRVGKGAGR